MTSPGCDLSVEDLEALVRKDLPPDEQQRVEAHLAGCPSCQRELLWLRVEQDLMTRRAEGLRKAPEALWPGIAQGLARRRRFAAAGAWLGYGAAAASLVVGVLAVQHAIAPAGHHVGASWSWGTATKDEEGGAREARLAAPGPFTLHLETLAADIRVLPGRPHEVSMSVSGAEVRNVGLQAQDHDVTALFDGRGALPEGQVRVQLPPGCAVDARTKSGDVAIEQASDAVRVRTLSGDVRVRAAGDAPPNLDVDTTTGEIEWSGACGAGCALKAHTLSGDVSLRMARKSSFRLDYQSQSGDLHDRLGLAPLPRPAAPQKEDRDDEDAPGRRVYGQGAGTVDCTTVSGDLEVSPL